VACFLMGGILFRSWAGNSFGLLVSIIALFVVGLAGFFTLRLQQQRDHAFETARESERRYGALMEDQLNLICRFDLQGRITSVNEAYCRFHGKSAEKLIGSPFMAFMPSLPAEDQDIPLS